MTSIPPIPTFTAGSIPTAAQLNQLGTAINFWANPPSCLAYRNAAANFSNSVYQAIPFDANQIDTDTMHNVSTNNTQITGTATGTYLVSAQATFAFSATGARGMQVRKNSAGNPNGGTLLLQTYPIAASNTYATAIIIPTTQISLTSGDYVEFFAFQSSGGTLGLQTGVAATFGCLRLMGQ